METNRVVDIDILDEMKKSYIDYAMSVIVSRALPDIRDGLKPVHRRILYAMKELNFTHDKPHRKSARIVGDVLGKYHPHGDSSVYNAMVRMAQEFSIRYPLVDGHGNFGSIDGDSAAAMRYTEARMSKIASALLADIDKETIDYRMNFDETTKEPVVLPSRFPNLLVNGSNGIAVGMATSIPPHNLCEVIDGTIHLMDHPDATVEDLMTFIKGPDFPTGAEILGLSGIKRAYERGRGRIKVRSKAEIVDIRNGKSAIIVSEIPYQTNKSKMLEGIADLVKNKKIDGITDLRDESDRTGIRVVIELRKDVNANVVLNQLYKYSQLQSTYSIIFIALLDGEPRVFNLKQMLNAYIAHQKDVETRRVRFDLNKAEKRAHILEGFMIANANIDEIVELIKASDDKAHAQVRLIERFAFTEEQANAILEMRLHRLTGMERSKIEEELNALREEIKYLKSILNDEELLLSVIKEQLLAIKADYGDERRTELSVNYDELDMESLIEEEDVVITLTHAGYIKRMPITEYNLQKRGGRGKSGLSTREEDFVVDIFTTSTHDHLLYFTNFGKVYRQKAYHIPESSRTSKGTAIINLLQLDRDEFVTSVVPINDFEEGYLTLVTEKGLIKRTAIDQFDTDRKNGLIAIHLRDGDRLIGVRRTTGDDDMIVVTSGGMAIRFHETDVREMGRGAMGVKAISLAEDDCVVSVDRSDTYRYLFVASEKGYGKLTKLDEYRFQNRGGKGLVTYKMTEKTGRVIGAMGVMGDEDLMIINSDGVLIRISLRDVSVSSRITQGVKLMRAEGDTSLVSMAKIMEDDEDEKDV